MYTIVQGCKVTNEHIEEHEGAPPLKRPGSSTKTDEVRILEMNSEVQNALRR